MSNVFNFDDDDQQNPFGQETDDAAAPQAGDAEDDEGGEGNNKTFMFVAIGLGALFLLSLLCAAGYFLFIFPNSRDTRLAAAQTATAVSYEAATAVSLTQQVLNATPTLEPTATFTPVPTNTPVLATATLFPAETGSGTGANAAPGAGGVDATNTQQAANNATATRYRLDTLTPLGAVSGTPTLPTAGFADEVGIPMLFIGALLLVAVLFLARRLRGSLR